MSAGCVLLAWPGLRARAYLQTMERAGLAPDHVVLLGPARADTTDAAWGTSFADSFDASEPLRATLARSGWSATEVAETDVNAPPVVAAVRDVCPGLAIFSGGGILGEAALQAAPRWLHVHPGRLPEYRGSTCIYYSLLLEGRAHATAFFLQRTLDSGPIVAHRSFEVPPGLPAADLDHVFDAWIRATVLVDALRALARGQVAVPPPASASPGCEFTIIHPVLKHLAAQSLQRDRAPGAFPEEPL